jgi:ubiquinone/menaquinone biosynthesis C-methylase UbiE
MSTVDFESKSIKEKDQIIWQFYAYCYDAITKLDPYQEHLNKIINYLEASAGMIVLDAGCGIGNLEVLLEKTGAKITAVDYSQSMITRAKKKCPLIEFRHVDLNEPLSFQNNCFERIVCSNAMYTLRNPAFTVSEFFRTLKDGGKIVISNPTNNPNPLSILKSHITKKGIRSLIPVVIPLLFAGIFNALIVQNKNYHFLSERELISLLEDHDFNVCLAEPAYVDQNMLVVATKKSVP